MKQLLNILKPIHLESEDNIFLIGLSLRDGIVRSVKIYNKIYKHNDQIYDFITENWGIFCANCYIKNEDWMQLYPGFSGFTLGIEFDLEAKPPTHVFGYGFKTITNKIIYHAFLINEQKNIINQQDYEYVDCKKMHLPNKPIKTDLIEVQINKVDKYCYCPQINKQNIKQLHKDILNSLSEKNKKFIEYSIDDKSFLLVNYGVSADKEKIYLLTKNKNKIIDIMKFLEKLNLPLDSTVRLH